MYGALLSFDYKDLNWTPYDTPGGGVLWKRGAEGERYPSFLKSRRQFKPPESLGVSENGGIRNTGFQVLRTVHKGPGRAGETQAPARGDEGSEREESCGCGDGTGSVCETAALWLLPVRKD